MKSVAICGSRRFKKEIREFAKKLKDDGIVVYEPILNENRNIDTLETDLKRYAFLGLVFHHIEQIRKADVIFVYNKGGYIGNSTTMEIGAAAALSKPIYALEDDTAEICRNVIIEKVVSSASKLVKLLL